MRCRPGPAAHSSIVDDATPPLPSHPDTSGSQKAAVYGCHHYPNLPTQRSRAILVGRPAARESTSYSPTQPRPIKPPTWTSQMTKRASVADDKNTRMPSVLDRELDDTAKDAFGHQHYADALRDLIESPLNAPPSALACLALGVRARVRSKSSIDAASKPTNPVRPANEGPTTSARSPSTRGGSGASTT